MESVENFHVIVGLGATGLSCARYLYKNKIPFALVDSRSNPPNLAEFKKLFPDVQTNLGNLDNDLLDKAEKIVISPGISLKTPGIQKQIQRGIAVIGDIELFAQAVKKPIVAITGTNAKSTVTTVVGKMAEDSGKKVKVGGNLGIPALELLSDAEADLYVLELSSFQLESTYSLAPKVATVLNVTPDHMDRYSNLKEYQQAKQRVYLNCEVAVCNRDDDRTDCGGKFNQHKMYFTLYKPIDDEFGLINKNGQNYLAFENKILMPVRDLPILGKHYQANALAALAIGHGLGLPFETMLKTLINFKGLPHRCQIIRELDGINWYNDSKGTNVGATLAAINGLGSEMDGKIVLIAGGVGKNADFTSLIPAIEKYVKAVVLIGEAAPILANVIGDRLAVHFAPSMEDAVYQARKLAQSGDGVLLSPACASFDMFNNFEHRGEVFASIVQGLI